MSIGWQVRFFFDGILQQQQQILSEDIFAVCHKGNIVYSNYFCDQVWNKRHIATPIRTRSNNAILTSQCACTGPVRFESYSPFFVCVQQKFRFADYYSLVCYVFARATFRFFYVTHRKLVYQGPFERAIFPAQNHKHEHILGNFKFKKIRFNLFKKQHFLKLRTIIYSYSDGFGIHCVLFER